MASWLAGVAMSTTSVAVVYAVMLEFGFNATDYGKVVLAACFAADVAVFGLNVRGNPGCCCTQCLHAGHPQQPLAKECLTANS